MQDTKKIESRIQELEDQIKNVVEKCNESRTTLKTIEDVVPNVDQETIQTEAIKYHVCYIKLLLISLVFYMI